MRLALVLSLAVVVASGCGQPVRIVGQNGAVRVQVVNPPRPRGEGAGTWVNDCQPIARLGASETRTTWLRRIEDFVEGRAQRLASITYPPGDGLEVALVCFSTHAD